jgi:hypothetical protein
VSQELKYTGRKDNMIDVARYQVKNSAVRTSVKMGLSVRCSHSFRSTFRYEKEK